MSVPEGLLICDDPPGPAGCIVRSPMTAPEVERIKHLWQTANVGVPRQLAMVLDQGPVARQWPDAEFCAA